MTSSDPRAPRAAVDGFTPVQRSTIREAARDALRDLIISGQLTAEGPLRQDDLASRLGISRTPLREALYALAGEGLVTIDPHRGAMVTKPSVQQLRHLYEIREELEVLAGRKAVAASTPEHAARLQALHEEMTDSHDPTVWAEQNRRFHASLYAVCDNRELIQMIDLLGARAKFFVRILASTGSPTRRAQGDHGDMIQALVRRDPDAMERAIRRHLQATIEVVAPALDVPGESPTTSNG